MPAYSILEIVRDGFAVTVQHRRRLVGIFWRAFLIYLVCRFVLAFVAENMALPDTAVDVADIFMMVIFVPAALRWSAFLLDPAEAKAGAKAVTPLNVLHGWIGIVFLTAFATAAAAAALVILSVPPIMIFAAEPVRQLMGDNWQRLGDVALLLFFGLNILGVLFCFVIAPLTLAVPAAVKTPNIRDRRFFVTPFLAGPRIGASLLPLIAAPAVAHLLFYGVLLLPHLIGLLDHMDTKRLAEDIGTLFAAPWLPVVGLFLEPLIDALTVILGVAGATLIYAQIPPPAGANPEQDDPDATAPTEQST